MKSKCPVCDVELERECGDGIVFAHPKGNVDACPIGHRLLDKYELSEIVKSIEISEKRGYEQAREQAAQIVLNSSTDDNDDYWSHVVEIDETVQRIRAMQPEKESERA